VLGLGHAPAAAVLPTLIACLAVMTRAEPCARSLAFYLGRLIATVMSGVVVLAEFNDGNTVLGSTSSTQSLGTSITTHHSGCP
jgi:hypothetical protein